MKEDYEWKFETNTAHWKGRGNHIIGPDKDGFLYCLGGCGGLIGYIPPDAKWININLAWCKSCADKYRADTGEDPCFPRVVREVEVVVSIGEQQRFLWELKKRKLDPRSYT